MNALGITFGRKQPVPPIEDDRVIEARARRKSQWDAYCAKILDRQIEIEGPKSCPILDR